MKRWLEEKYHRAALLFAALFALLAALSLALALPMGLWWGEDFFRRKADGFFDAGAAGWVRVRDQEAGQAALTYFLERVGEGEAQLWVDGQGRVTIEYENGLAWHGREDQGILLDQEGWPAALGVSIVYGDGEGEAWEPERLSPFLWALCRKPLEHQAPWQRIFPAALLFAVGLLLWLFPEKMAFLGSGWFYRQPPEISQAGLFAQRAGALFGMVMSVIVLFLG